MDFRRCVGCEQSLPIARFSTRGGKEKRYYRSYCKSCSVQLKTEYYRRNPGKEVSDLKKRNERRDRRLEENRQYVFDWLSTHPCVDCGETDPIVLHFDHVRGEKKTEICYLVSRASSMDALKAEIEKCDTRCANCHTRKTAIQQNWTKLKRVKTQNSVTVVESIGR